MISRLGCRERCARLAVALPPALRLGVMAVAVVASGWGEAGSLNAQPAAPTAAMCGRTGDASQLLLALQKPSAERLWRDTKLFVMRDNDDGSLWAFSIKNSTVHPAVRCRRPLTGAAAPDVDAGLLCPAGEAACASFAAQADAKFDEAAAAAPRR